MLKGRRMTREEFKQIIKLRSIWKIDRRKGNYQLPGETKLSDYVDALVIGQMRLDQLGVMEDGNLCLCFGGKWNDEKKEFDGYELYPSFPTKSIEFCSYEEMERRVRQLVLEIVG